MRLSIWFSFILLLSMVAGCQKQPDFIATDGQAIYLKSAADRWTILNIWAQWCGPCRKEIPEFNALAKHKDLNVLGYDFDGDTGDRLKHKVRMMGIQFPVIEGNPLTVLELPLPQVLPTTLMINPQGKVMDILYGPQTEEGMIHRVNQLKKQGVSNGH